jgi:hypothetical protein
MLRRLKAWLRSCFGGATSLRDEFRHIEAGFDKLPPLEPQQIYLITFRHRGCQSEVARYRGPDLKAGMAMRAIDWEINGVRPDAGAGSCCLCPDCGQCVPISSAGLEEIDRHKSIPGYEPFSPDIATWQA